MRLHLDKAREALATIGTRLGLTVEQTADAVLQVATANIYAEAVPQLARRGVDAKDFSLLCYGAAGPTHSFMLARELKLRRVIVPPMPGLLCALGCLVADLRADFVRSLWHDSRAMTDAQINATYGQFSAEAENWLATQNVDVLERRIVRSIDMCYQGQSFELNVILPDGPLTIAQIQTLFHDHYERVYGYADRSSPLRILEARLQVIGSTRKPDFSRLKPFAAVSGGEPVTRRIYENGEGGEATVYQRAALAPGFRFEGPAIVEQYDTTVYVPAGFSATIDRWYNIIGEQTS
jgi:N-methylhydantoinase A